MAVLAKKPDHGKHSTTPIFSRAKSLKYSFDLTSFFRQIKRPNSSKKALNSNFKGKRGRAQVKRSLMRDLCFRTKAVLAENSALLSALLGKS